jgi:hypothetical protein
MAQPIVRASFMNCEFDFLIFKPKLRVEHFDGYKTIQKRLSPDTQCRTCATDSADNSVLSM